MRLGFEKIKEITKGAVRILNDDKYIRFCRFTEEQTELLSNWEFHVSCTAGIKLEFKTDSERLFLKVHVPDRGLRKYFSFDVFVNEKPIGYISNFNEKCLPQKYDDVELQVGGEFSKSFELGKGIKKVCIYFPWSVIGELEELSLDDTSFCESIPNNKKILAFGDSITQGYDALRPSKHHIARIAEKLDVEVINKAVAGEKFFSDFAKTKDDIEPEFVIVAYGTNDWTLTERDEMIEACKGFYENLSLTYPQSTIFAISPVWRTDECEETKFGKFTDIEKEIERIVKNLENVTFISGYNLIPHNKECFADFWVHPNDEGFDFYYNNLYEHIKSNVEF